IALGVGAVVQPAVQRDSIDPHPLGAGLHPAGEKVPDFAPDKTVIQRKLQHDECCNFRSRFATRTCLGLAPSPTRRAGGPKGPRQTNRVRRRAMNALATPIPVSGEPEIEAIRTQAAESSLPASTDFSHIQPGSSVWVVLDLQNLFMGAKGRGQWLNLK